MTFKKGSTPWNKGAKGLQVAWNKGKSYSVAKNNPQIFKKGHHPETEFKKGEHPSPKTEFKKGMTPHNKGKIGIYKPTKEAIKKCLKRNPKSSLEMKFEKIINKLNLPYKFVGNGEVLIGRKCPDFVNTNGQKIAIEVYYRRHKEQFRNGLDSWKSEREKIFKQYGWDLKFFDETQVNKEEINMILNKHEGRMS